VFHVKHEGSPWEALSPEQQDRLRMFEELLGSTALPRGMVASSDSDRLHERHVLDSLRAVPLVPEDAVRICDLGSGAGLPGVPLAIAEPRLEVTLSEPRLQRVAFLEFVVERLDLANVEVSAGPAQGLPTLHFDVCLARGLADGMGSWAIGAPLLAARGRLIYWAGRSFREEHAPTGVRVQVVTSPLESSGPIVIMTRQ
jgi:16S rRNA (guanine527-N7)-methyltransferase